MTAAAAVCGGKWGSARSQYCVLSGSHEQHQDSGGRTWGRRRGAKPEPVAIQKAREVMAEFERLGEQAGTGTPGWAERRAVNHGRAIGALDLLLKAFDEGELR